MRAQGCANGPVRCASRPCARGAPRHTFSRMWTLSTMPTGPSRVIALVLIACLQCNAKVDVDRAAGPAIELRRAHSEMRVTAAPRALRPERLVQRDGHVRAGAQEHRSVDAVGLEHVVELDSGVASGIDHGEREARHHAPRAPVDRIHRAASIARFGARRSLRIGVQHGTVSADGAPQGPWPSATSTSRARKISSYSRS